MQRAERSWRIDNAWCLRQIRSACRSHDSLEQASCAGLRIDRVRDEVITHCMPYAFRLSETIVRLPKMSRIDQSDLESAALFGLTEGVSCFKLSKGVLLATHTHVWIRKRLLEARNDGHWAIAKPPDDLAADYMADRLDPLEKEAYINTFIRQQQLPWEEDFQHRDNMGAPGQ